MRKIFLAILVAIVLGSVQTPAVLAGDKAATEQVTYVKRAPGFTPLPQQTSFNSLTHDGRVMVFQAHESSVVPGDTNGVTDVFAYDRVTKKTERLSMGLNGQQTNGASFNATISADGRYVAYVTQATNVTDEVKCGKKGCALVVVLDRQTKKVTPVSLSTLGLPLVIDTFYEGGYFAGISADGNFVVFTSPSSVSPADTNNASDVLVRDIKAKVTRLASLGTSDQVGASGAWNGRISGDGRYVTFSSINRLMPDDFNGASDIYIRDMQLGTTDLVSRAYNGGVDYGERRGSYAAAISNDGRFVVFLSSSNEIIKTDYSGTQDVFVRNLPAKSTRRINNPEFSSEPNSHAYDPSISADGSYIAYESYASNLVKADDNGMSDIFLYHRREGITRRISLPPPAANTEHKWPSFPVISGDGKAISFRASTVQLEPYELATNLYLHYNPLVHLPFGDDNSIIDIF